MAKRVDSPAVTSFFLADSSPMIHYTAPEPSTWTMGYALQSDGWDSTVHLTSHNQSIISFDITATSITFLIPYFPNCTSTLKLNASISVPACATPAGAFTLQNLPRGLHTVEYTTSTIPAGQDVSFWGIDATRPYDGTQWGNVTIDDAQKGRGVGGLTYTGEWAMEGGASGAANKTLAGSSKKGASVEFVGRGSAIYLYGNTGPQYSSASITLDDNIVDKSLNFSANWASSYQLLWFRTGLDASRESKVVMANLEDKRITLDFVVITAHSDEIAKYTASKPFLSTIPGKLVTFALGPLIAAILLAFLAIYYIRRRRASRSAPSRSSKSMQHHESFQNLRSSYLDFGQEPSPPTSALADKERFEYQQQLRYAPSERSAADDLVVTYEEGKKRLSERARSAAWSPASPFTHSAYAPTEDSRGGRNGTPAGPPSPGTSPLNFHPDRYQADTPSGVGSARSSFLRPFQFLVAGKRASRAPALSPTQEGDISLSAASPLSGFGSPTSGSAGDAELTEWHHATAQPARLQSFSQFPASPTSQLFTSSLPLSSAGGMSPGQRFRPSDAPSGRTSISFSDVMSVMAAPPSVRDTGDLRSVHTGRSGPDNGFYPREEAVPALPVSADFTGIAPRYGIQPLRTGSRPPPTAFHSPRGVSGSYRKAPPSLPPTSYSPSTPMTFTRVDLLPGTHSSPARPESTTNGSPLASPTMEAARLQYESAMARHMSGMSGGSEYTATSAARPDSSIIPFEEFVAGLKEGQRRIDADREREKGVEGRSPTLGAGQKGGRV